MSVRSIALALGFAFLSPSMLRASAECPEEHDESVDCEQPATPCKPGSPEGPGQAGCSGAFVHRFENLPIELTWSSQGALSVDEGMGRGILASWSLAVTEVRSGMLGVRDAGHATVEFIPTATEGLYSSANGDGRTLRQTEAGYTLEGPAGESTLRFEKRLGKFTYLTSERHRSGEGADIEWGDSLPRSITDPISGRTMDVSSEDGHVVALSDGRGRRYEFSYANGFLSQISFPDGSSRSLSWTQDGSNFLTEVSDPVRKAPWKMTYYANGAAKSSSWGPLKEEFRYPISDTVVRLQFGEKGQLRRVLRTDYEHGFISRVMVGNGTTSDPADPATMVTTARFEHDPSGRVTKSWDGVGQLQEFFYEKDGSCSAAPSGAPSGSLAPTCVKRQDGSRLVIAREPSSGLMTSSKSFGASGALLSTSATRYTQDGRLSEVEVVNEGAPSVRASLKLAYDPSTGQASSNEVFFEHHFQYDSHGRLLKLVTPIETREYEYSSAGDLSAVTTNGRRAEIQVQVNRATGGASIATQIDGLTSTVTTNFDGSSQAESVSLAGRGTVFSQQKGERISELGFSQTEENSLTSPSGAATSSGFRYSNTSDGAKSSTTFSNFFGEGGR